jgi:valyl-tRNA synthetase
MTKLASLTVDPEAVRARDAATVVVHDVEVFISGVIDVDKERDRLTKQREQLVTRLQGSRKKLSNQNFVSRAKPEVVDRERELVGELERQLGTVDQTLSELDA